MNIFREDYFAMSIAMRRLFARFYKIYYDMLRLFLIILYLVKDFLCLYIGIALYSAIEKSFNICMYIHVQYIKSSYILIK